MDAPFQVTFRGIPHSDAIEAAIQERAEGLRLVHPRIVKGKVVIDAPHQHHRKGKHYLVHIDVSVPGKVLVVNRDPAPRAEHADAYVAIRDAFAAAERILHEHVRKRRDGVIRRKPRGTLDGAGSR